MNLAPLLFDTARRLLTNCGEFFELLGGAQSDLEIKLLRRVLERLRVEAIVEFGALPLLGEHAFLGAAALR